MDNVIRKLYQFLSWDANKKPCLKQSLKKLLDKAFDMLMYFGLITSI